VVLDTITTRFLMLFLIFLFIPLFTLMFFTVNALDNQLEERSQAELVQHTILVQDLLKREGDTLSQLAQVAARMNPPPCPSLQVDLCQRLPSPWAGNHSDAQAILFPQLLSALPPTQGSLQPPKSFFAFSEGKLFLLAISPAGQNGTQGLLLGKQLNSSWLNTHTQHDPLLESVPIWIADHNPQINNVLLFGKTPIAGNTRTLEALLTEMKALPGNPGTQTPARIKGDNGESLISQVILRDGEHRPVARILLQKPLQAKQTILTHYYYAIYFISLVSLVLSMILAMIVARSITQPLLKLIEQVDWLSRTGDLSREVSIRGVHEIFQLSEAFNRMLKRLRQEHQMKDEFVATLTHDLKVPLLAEKQTLAYLNQKLYGPLSDPQQEVIHLMQSSNDSVLRLVNGILEVYRYDSGQINLVFDQIDAKALLDETIRELQPLYLEKMITLTVESKLHNPQQAIARIDRLEIKRVFTNLLSNAIANTPKHGQIRCLLADSDALNTSHLYRLTDLKRTSLDRPVKLSGRLLLSIQDSGIGFMTEDLPQLFRRFAANRGRNPMSIGLGLYNCYQVIQAHGGVLWVETTEGEGAAVCFVLPLTAEIAQERRKYGGRRMTDRANT
jgi:signal transduction histidine kinase